MIDATYLNVHRTVSSLHRGGFYSYRRIMAVLNRPQRDHVRISPLPFLLLIAIG